MLEERVKVVSTRDVVTEAEAIFISGALTASYRVPLAVPEESVSSLTLNALAGVQTFFKESFIVGIATPLHIIRSSCLLLLEISQTQSKEVASAKVVCNSGKTLSFCTTSSQA